MSIMNLFNGGGSVRSRTNRPNMRDIAGPIRDTINPRNRRRDKLPRSSGGGPPGRGGGSSVGFNQEKGTPSWLPVSPGRGFLRKEEPNLPPWHQNNLGGGEGSFWNVRADQPRQDSGIMMADSGDIMNKYKRLTDKFGDFDIGGDGIEYKKDFGIPWGGTGTIEGYGGGDDYGGGINFSWPLGQTSALGTELGGLDEYQTAELGLPQPMDWQKDRLTLDELINLGASEEQIARYLGVA